MDLLKVPGQQESIHQVIHSYSLDTASHVCRQHGCWQSRNSALQMGLPQGQPSSIAQFIGMENEWIQRSTLLELPLIPFNLDMIVRSRPPTPARLQAAQSHDTQPAAVNGSDFSFNHFTLPGLPHTAWLEGRPLLIRDTYPDLVKELQQIQTSGQARRVILQGHAFFGKSSFLAYLFIYRISAGLPTVYLPPGSETYIQVIDGGVRYLWLEEINQSAFKEEDNVWLLLDCEKPEPIRTNWFIAQVCTEIRRAEMKAQRLFKDGSATKVLVMEPWTWKETLAVLYLNNSSIATDPELLGKNFSVFNCYGPHPGLCVGLLSPQLPFDTWCKRLRLYEKGINVRIASLLGKGDITCETCGLEYSNCHSYPHSHSFDEDEDLTTKLIAMENPRDRIVMAVPDAKSSKGYKETWLTKYVEEKFWKSLENIEREQGKEGVKGVFGSLKVSRMGDFGKRLTSELWAYLVRKRLKMGGLELRFKGTGFAACNATHEVAEVFRLSQDFSVRVLPSDTKFTELGGDHTLNKLTVLPSEFGEGGVILLDKLKLLFEGKRITVNPVLSILEFAHEPALRQPALKEAELEKIWNALARSIKKPQVITPLLEGLRVTLGGGKEWRNRRTSISGEFRPPIIHALVVPKGTTISSTEIKQFLDGAGKWRDCIIPCSIEVGSEIF